MAKGDVIAGYLSAAGTFQPASGVECIMTSLSLNSLNNAARVWSHHDGAPRGVYCVVPVNSYGDNMNVKIPVSNTNCIYCNGDGSYSGLQVK